MKAMKACFSILVLVAFLPVGSAWGQGSNGCVLEQTQLNVSYDGRAKMAADYERRISSLALEREQLRQQNAKLKKALAKMKKEAESKAETELEE